MGWERSDHYWVNSKRSWSRLTTRGRVRKYHRWPYSQQAPYRNRCLLLLVIKIILILSAIVVVQSLSCIQLFATPWTVACQASLSLTISQSLPRFMSFESVMLSNHFILCYSLLSPSIFPSIRICFNESVLPIRWPKYQKLQLQHQSFQWVFRVDFL